MLPERAVNVVARPFTWLHRPFALVSVLLALAAFDVWLFWIHGVAGGIRAVLYSPVLLLGVLASIVVATAFHEVGHASACRYSGARPSAMGVGIYLIWPAFYCDVTDAYRLNRRGRLRTDLGGVYFNGIFALMAGVGYFASGNEALLLIAVVQHSIALQQLLPLLRFDGYYVLSDLTGVPDILSRIKPIFRSLLPGRREPRVEELKSWVRFVVTAYLLVLVPDARVHDRLDAAGGAADGRDGVGLARAAARPHRFRPRDSGGGARRRRDRGALAAARRDGGKPEPQREDGRARHVVLVGRQHRAPSSRGGRDRGRGGRRGLHLVAERRLPADPPRRARDDRRGRGQPAEAAQRAAVIHEAARATVRARARGGRTSRWIASRR